MHLIPLSADLAIVLPLPFCVLVPFPFLLVAKGLWHCTDIDAVAIRYPSHLPDNILREEGPAYSRCISNPIVCYTEDESRCLAAVAEGFRYILLLEGQASSE